jgi:type VI secretion system secreted protein Hcp
MAVDAFIWFETESASGMRDVVGETKDDYFSKVKPQPAFEIKDFSFDCENPTTLGSATGGAGAGKAKFGEFNITKLSDSASPAFFMNCVAGAHYKKVTLAMRKAGANKDTTGGPFLIYTFGTVFTTKIGWDGPGDEGANEKISFAYGTLQIKYNIQKPDGTMDKSVAEQGWSQVLNKTSVPYPWSDS